MRVHRISPEAGRPAGSDYFVGEVQVQPLVAPAEGLDLVVVRFSPGARTYLHSREAVQVLQCIEGKGILATETERHEVGPGDVVHVPAGELHWHGAARDSAFVHLSIRAPGDTHWTQIDPLAAEG